MPTVVCAGETMVLLAASHPGRLRHQAQVEVRIAGAESNVAIALSRLGIEAGWASWLGDDEFGELVLARIRAEGVDTTAVRRVAGPTGLHLREYLPDGARVYYYRQGSAASRMGQGAFPAEYLEGARFLHITGVTPALSAACREFTVWAVAEAGRRGVRVSYDVNYRSKLWPADQARAFAESVLPLVSTLFLSDDEGGALWHADGEALARSLASQGPGEVIVKRGASGCLAWLDGRTMASPAFPVTLVDPVGAGDAFAAGYLAASLWGLEGAERLRIANAMGAYSVFSRGDYEGLPARGELLAFVEGRRELGR